MEGGSDPARLLIVHSDEVKTLWGCGHSGFRALGAVQQIPEVLEAAAAVCDLDHRADQDPDHVLHEGIAGDPELARARFEIIQSAETPFAEQGEGALPECAENAAVKRPRL